MNYVLEVKESALIDTLEASVYYEQKRTDLGLEFLSELDHMYDLLRENPYLFAEKEEGIREAIMHRFPYVVVFRIKEQSVIVYAVFNTYQDPVKKL